MRRLAREDRRLKRAPYTTALYSSPRCPAPVRVVPRVPRPELINETAGGRLPTPKQTIGTNSANFA
jgi:hypothetical protein